MTHLPSETPPPSSSEANADQQTLALPNPSALPIAHAGLAEQARAYAEASRSANTQRAYEADWRHFTAWCRRQGVAALPAHPPTLGLYLSACASGEGRRKPDCVSTIGRRLSALTWHYAERGDHLDRADRHIALVMAGIRRTHGRPPVQKEAVLPDDLKAMLAVLDQSGLRGIRDRAILLIGFAGGFRRSEIVGLDCGDKQMGDGTGWIEILPEGLVVTVKAKTGWREVVIGRGSSPITCPVHALETWLKLSRIGHGPVFRRVTGQGKETGVDRLNDRHVARLVKQAALAAGVRGDLSEGEREEKFAGHSLRAGLATSAEIEERHVQKQLGHASAEMTRRYQRRRDRFRINLTKAAGL